MERYEPKDRQEALHYVIGNLFLADSLKDALDSKDRILDILHVLEKGFPFAAQARLSLSREWNGYELAYIYVPRAKHTPSRDRPKRDDSIVVFDETASRRVEIPTLQPNLLPFDRTPLMEIWESDIILLTTYYIGNKPKVGYALSHFFDDFIKNPRRFLGTRLVRPRFPSF